MVGMRKTMSLLWLNSLILLFALPSVVVSQAAQNPAGDWILKLDQRTLLILSIRQAASKGQTFSGSLSRPRQFQTRDGVSFSHIQGVLCAASN
jgi:hypothetical protein